MRPTPWPAAMRVDARRLFDLARSGFHGRAHNALWPSHNHNDPMNTRFASKCHAVPAIVARFFLPAVFALACLGIGTIVRSSAGAIVVALVWPIVAEPTTLAILNALKHGSWGKWLPFLAGGQLASASRDTDFLRPWPGYIWFAAFSLALLVFGAWLLEQRDA